MSKCNCERFQSCGECKCEFNKTSIFYFLKAQDVYFEDFSDAKWFQALQDSVVEWNKTRGTNYDPYETVLNYVKETSE